MKETSQQGIQLNISYHFAKVIHKVKIIKSFLEMKNGVFFAHFKTVRAYTYATYCVILLMLVEGHAHSTHRAGKCWNYLKAADMIKVAV